MSHEFETIESLMNIVALGREKFGTNQLIIAGGAPRDIISGVPVKDIDIFVNLSAIDAAPWEVKPGTFPDDVYPVPFQVACALFAQSMEATFEFDDTQEGYACDVCRMVTNDGPIEVIALKNGMHPIDDVPNYDFGLSQVFVTPTGVFQSNNATDDRLRRTITYRPSNLGDHAVARSARRYGRLQEKYPDWRFVNCESLVTHLFLL